ncbi:MAG TPA: DNA repair protein RecN [Chloroflexota bacterium]|nr:DNA repair protein RecN [Chloroflexota bacterium]
MLIELSIENFAIIDRLRLQLGSGFTVLTGETGAGKSIIIDALQAALGARVGADVIRGDAAAASVEAIFELESGERDALGDLLGDYGVEEDDTLILRREVNASGRGTARLNGRAVPVGVLSAVGAALVDIHGQSDHLSILRRDRQLDILDRFGDLLPLRSEVATAVRRYASARRDLEALAAGRREAEQRLDLLRFQVGEIEAASLRAEEEDDLAAERNLLANAERLTQLAAGAYEALHEEGAAIERVGEAGAAARDLAAIDAALAPLSERLDAAMVELDDVAQEIRRYRDAVEYDPGRLAEIEERLDVLMRLKRKYGPTLDDVIAFGRQARADLEGVEHIDERLDELQADVASAEAEAGRLAEDLSHARAEAGQRLTDEMGAALQGLGLKGTAFSVELARTERPDGLPVGAQSYAYSASGIDTVTFLVSFNPGEPLRPMERVASGGETSRFLLALKSVLAEADRTPTLVFDEVDVGVGGRRAHDVGQRMRRLAAGHQVLSITHMPQIAALADRHLTVVKAIREGRTAVDVRGLEHEERVAEIAEMMSGTGTEAARRNAAELLAAARRDIA